MRKYITLVLSVKKKLLWVAGIAFLLILGLLLPSGLLFSLTMAFAKSLVILGVVLLMRAGLISFGQGLFFALGAYTVAFAMKWLNFKEAFLLVPLGAIMGVAFAGLLGLLTTKYRSIFFAMLTLAFSMVLYGVLVKLYGITGGSDGMGVRPPTFLGLSPPESLLQLIYYYFTLLFVGPLMYTVYRFFVSPMGFLGQALYNNEVRVEYMGISVSRVLYRTYLIAGLLGGLGGALHSFNVGHVAPDLTYWTTSGEFVFVALLGGTGNAFGPVAGAVVFELFKGYALRYMPYIWHMLVGIMMLLIIIFIPQGLEALYNIATQQWKERWKSF